MSINIVAVYRGGAIAGVDRRIELRERVTDATRINKLFNYRAPDFHGSLAFVESPQPKALTRYMEAGLKPLFALNWIDALNDLTHSNPDNNRDFTSHPVYETAGSASLDDFIERGVKEAFSQVHSQVGELSPGDYPILTYVFFDKKMGEFTRGIILYVPEERCIRRIGTDYHYIAMGDGKELAEEYLDSLKRDFTGLELAPCTFYLSNAYMNARKNRAVGGTWKVTQITPAGLTIVERAKRCAMNTMSGAYMAEREGNRCFTETVDEAELIDLVKQLLRTDNTMVQTAYQRIAQLTNQTPESVQTSSPGINYWLERGSAHAK